MHVPQILQLVASDASWYLPLAHSVHRCADASTKVPGEHTGQTPSKATPHLSRGRPLPHVPHLLQLLASDTFWYVPSAHGVQRCEGRVLKGAGRVHHSDGSVAQTRPCLLLVLRE